MARLARVVATGVPHHVTQRGSARRLIFDGDADRLVYLKLLAAECRLQKLSLLGFCQMPNHVHLILVPPREEALALALRGVHGRYAAYLNARQSATGHVWQGRFYSCPLDGNHLWAALRYTERNPVRAGLVTEAERYRWSSAAVHCGWAGSNVPVDIDLAPWCSCWNIATWREFLDEACADEEVDALRRSTHTGRPLGSADFVSELERRLQRPLRARKGGRPPRVANDEAPELMAF